MNLMRCLSAVVYECYDIGIAFGRCGFAQSQEAYDTAVSELFSTLDMLDDHLGRSRFLCGGTLTLADICLFTTLIRFDLVYNVLFKCTKKKLLEYSNLHAYMRDLYQVPFTLSQCPLACQLILLMRAIVVCCGSMVWNPWTNWVL